MTSIPSADEHVRPGATMDTPHPIRILCVDDYDDVAESTALVLRVCGYEAEACYGGRQALALAERFHPDAYLIDINMPGMDGCELARRLRSAPGGDRLLLVAVTAMGADEVRGRTAAAGFDRHLVKPVNPFDLLAVLSRLTPPPEPTD